MTLQETEQIQFSLFQFISVQLNSFHINRVQSNSILSSSSSCLAPSFTYFQSVWAVQSPVFSHIFNSLSLFSNHRFIALPSPVFPLGFMHMRLVFIYPSFHRWLLFFRLCWMLISQGTHCCCMAQSFYSPQPSQKGNSSILKDRRWLGGLWGNSLKG